MKSEKARDIVESYINICTLEEICRHAATTPVWEFYSHIRRSKVDVRWKKKELNKDTWIMWAYLEGDNILAEALVGMI